MNVSIFLSVFSCSLSCFPLFTKNKRVLQVCNTRFHFEKSYQYQFLSFLLFDCLFCTNFFALPCNYNPFMIEYAKIHSHTVYFFFVHFFVHQKPHLWLLTRARRSPSFQVLPHFLGISPTIFKIYCGKKKCFL